MQPSDNLVHPKGCPVVISTPSSARVRIVGRTNADFHQRVTVKEVGREEYIFEGSGENKAMTLKGGNVESVDLGPLEADDGKFRTWTFNFQNSSSGAEDSFTASKVLRPVYHAVHDAEYKVQAMEWEISSEDNIDDDYNDAVIRLVADL
ncbi:hypothetical protein BDV26DRAFT_287766 [Aspergillus bertholletiae]|uniref:Uncharacterized protein n=1 Tax=Aspergillus bertholletiae TaxID=1226010 RepID=A0A5N7BN61_9EURO|nr:hypothetical protein BDV26DRAFT_287766 [Aspergillus bertholletiae]